jgi:hypothetical protein
MPWPSAAVVAPTMIAIVAMSVFKVMFLLRELGTDAMSMPVDFGRKIIAAQVRVTSR